jgi:hypothetical protein
VAWTGGGGEVEGGNFGAGTGDCLIGVSGPGIILVVLNCEFVASICGIACRWGRGGVKDTCGYVYHNFTM